MNLDKKRILFIAPKFYHYHTEVIKSLESQGANVIFYQEMIQSIIYRVSNKFSKKLESYLKNKYLNSILENTLNDMYDIVFVIRGGYLSPSWLERLHVKLPNAKFFMYQWDSTRQNNYLPLIKYFDKVQTFDMVDAKKYDLAYLPLFYTNQYKKLQKDKKKSKYNLVFFGAYHSDRLEIIKYIDELFKENNLIFKYHLYITRLALFRLLLTRVVSLKDIHFFKTHSVSLNEIIETYIEADAVLDIELSIQNGLTMRTFETLGANLKLVTTNKNIKKEIFYDSQRIMYIDRDNIQIDLDFFKKENNFDNKFEEFNIDTWVQKILV